MHTYIGSTMTHTPRPERLSGTDSGATGNSNSFNCNCNYKGQQQYPSQKYNTFAAN